MEKFTETSIHVMETLHFCRQQSTCHRDDCRRLHRWPLRITCDPTIAPVSASLDCLLFSCLCLFPGVLDPLQVQVSMIFCLTNRLFCCDLCQMSLDPRLCSQSQNPIAQMTERASKRSQKHCHKTPLYETLDQTAENLKATTTDAMKSSQPGRERNCQARRWQIFMGGGTSAQNLPFLRVPPLAPIQKFSPWGGHGPSATDLTTAE